MQDLYHQKSSRGWRIILEHKRPTQSLQLSVMKECASIHIGTLITVEGIFLNQGLLEALGSSRGWCVLIPYDML